MSLTKYFRFPFALTGDKTPIDEETQPSGVVSFQEGYGIDYELDPATEPSAKNIERDKANQLYYDITQAIKEYQEFGAPYWIEAAQNGGVAFPYEKYALVRYDTGTETPIFQSLVDNNTALPTDTSSWKQLTSSDEFVVDSATFEASVSNGEVVYWDNANSRFDEAIANGTATQNAVGIADVTNSRVFLFGSIPSGVLSGLSANSAYYLSTTTPGAITTVRPAANAVQIGTSKSANTFFLNITPAQAAATESIAGIAEVASQAELNAGASDSVFITPLKARAGFAISLTSNGYIAFPTWLGGWIVQWAISTTPVNSNNNITVTFPITFPNAVLAINALLRSGGSTVTPTYDSPTTANFVLRNTTAGANSTGYSYIALGH